MEAWLDAIKLPLRDSFGRTVASLDIVSEGKAGTEVPRTICLCDDGETADGRETSVELMEDCRYSFRVESKSTTARLSIVADGGVISLSRVDAMQGWIDARTEAGLLPFEVDSVVGSETTRLTKNLSIRPAKFNPSEFRAMLDQIAEFSIDLLLSLSSRTQIRLVTHPLGDASTLQQQFAFLRWLIDSREFHSALTGITSSPHHVLREDSSLQPISRPAPRGSAFARELCRGLRRTPIPTGHPLSTLLPSVPFLVTSQSRRASVDTAENRFIKFCLETYRSALARVESLAMARQDARLTWLVKEAGRIRSRLEGLLQHTMFREVGPATFLPMGSPVLQRRRGYREVLHGWLRYQGAASLVWDGADDVVGGGKKGIERLYEYWLCLKLIEMLRANFGMPEKELDKLFHIASDGVTLLLKSGRSLSMEWDLGSLTVRPLHMRFSYNRTFKHSAGVNEEGAWTRTMRPDFTLSWWPSALTAEDAVRLELMVHVHLDSKYSVETVKQLFGSEDENVDDLKVSEKRGRYRRGDLHKMHTYRDAIRRSAGAYVLYPGDVTVPASRFAGYHELLPGLGAFAVKPSAGAEPAGMNQLRDFLNDVLRHVEDRTSAREAADYSRYSIYSMPRATKSAPEHIRVAALLPEISGPSGVRPRPVSDQVVVVCRIPNPDSAAFLDVGGILPIPIETRTEAHEISSLMTSDWIAIVSGFGGSPLRLAKVNTFHSHLVSASEVAGEKFHQATAATMYAMIDVDDTSMLGGLLLAQAAKAVGQLGSKTWQVIRLAELLRL